MSTEPEANPPTLWPSLLFAAVMAVLLPTFLYGVHTAFGEKDPLGFVALFEALWAPLVFGISWPICVAGEAAAGRFESPRQLARVYVALLLFAVSLVASVPMVAIEVDDLNSLVIERREGPIRAEAARRHFESSKTQIATRGIVSFPLPPAADQLSVLVWWIGSDSLTPAQADSVIDYYRSVPPLLVKLAERERITSGLLERLYGASSELQSRGETVGARDLIRAIAYNSNASPEVLTRILRGDDLYGRLSAAANERTPDEERRAYFRRASVSGEPKERSFVASDSLTPAGLLREMSADSSLWTDLARNPATPTDVLERMVTAPALRAQIGVHPNATPELVQLLRESPYPWARDYAVEWLATYDTVRTRGFATVAQPHRRAVSSAIARVLRADTLMPDQLRTAYDRLQKSPELLSVLAARPDIPPALLERLSVSGEFEVWQAADANPKLSAAARVASLRFASHSTNTIGLRRVASDRDTPADVLDSLSSGRYTDLAVISNPAAPKELLRKLAVSGSPWVAAAARERLR